MEVIMHRKLLFNSTDKNNITHIKVTSFFDFTRKTVVKKSIDLYKIIDLYFSPLCSEYLSLLTDLKEIYIRTFKYTFNYLLTCLLI
jgi:hypothetical protein